MAQDASHGHEQVADASSGDGTPPPATDSAGTLSPGKNSNSNSGSSNGIPVAEDAASKGTKNKDDVIVEEPPADASASTGSTHSSGAAGQSKGKSSSSAEVAAATDDDYNSVFKGKGKVAECDGKGAGASDRKRKQQMPHIITERERRKRMKNMFADLQAFLPNIPEKTDKATIVLEAFNFIKALQGTVAKLEKRKQDVALAQRATAVANLEAAALAPPPRNAAQTMTTRLPPLPQGWSWLPKQQPQKPAVAAAAAATSAPPAGFQSWSGSNVALSVSRDDAFITVCAPRRAAVLSLVLSVLEKHRVDVITVQVASDVGRCMFTLHARVNAAAIQQLGGEPPASEDIYKLAVSEVMVWLSS